MIGPLHVANFVLTSDTKPMNFLKRFSRCCDFARLIFRFSNALTECAIWDTRHLLAAEVDGRARHSSVFRPKNLHSCGISSTLFAFCLALLFGFWLWQEVGQFWQSTRRKNPWSDMRVCFD